MGFSALKNEIDKIRLKEEFKAGYVQSFSDLAAFVKALNI